MKFLDKLALKIFSLIIFVMAIVIVLLMTGILSINTIYNVFISLTDNEIAIKIAIGTFIVLSILAIKGLFFSSKAEDDGKEGIILENNSGKLVISKESLENLIASVTKEIPGTETVASKTILDKNKNLIVYVTAIVSKDVMIKEVSKELQRRVKEIMKKTADLEVNEINIKIKNVTSKKVKGLPAPENEIQVNEVETEQTNEVDSNEEKSVEE